MNNEIGHATIGVLLLWFVCMWYGLWYFFGREPDESKDVSQELEHEQAAHDAFMRKLERMGKE